MAWRCAHTCLSNCSNLASKSAGSFCEMDVLARSVKLCLHMNFCAQPPEALNEGYLLPMMTFAFAFNMMTETGR